MPTILREGDVTVTLSGELEAVSRRAVEQAIPGVLATMEAELRAVLDEARSEWPVRSGRSAASLRLEVELGDEVSVAIVSDVDYTAWVRPASWFGAETAWRRLVEKRVRAVHRRLVEELGQQIVEALRG